VFFEAAAAATVAAYSVARRFAFAFASSEL